MSRRFRRLEMEPARESAEPIQADTDICRRCGAEHPEGTPRCARCSGVLGGAGQDDFDVAHRARRELLEREAVRARVAVSAPPFAVPASGVASQAGGATQFMGLLRSAALVACLFALVSIPVRIAIAAAAAESLPWRGFLEIAVVIAITAALRRPVLRLETRA